MRMGCLKVSLIISQLIATFFLICGIAGVVFSILTSSWQTVNIAEHNELHLHGLLRDCVVKRKEDFTQDTKCTYKFNQNLEKAAHKHGHGKTLHISLPWHTSVLALLGTGTLMGVISLLFSFCAPWVSVCAVLWAIFSLISTICVTAGVVVYFFNSHDVDYLYIYASTQSYEQECGYSFWCAVAGSSALLFSSIFSVLTTVLLFVEKRKKHRNSTPMIRSRKMPKEIVHTHWNTNV